MHLKSYSDNCLIFVGLGHEGIYRKNGAKSRIKLLMEEFRKDARNVKLRIGDNFIEDVTDVLKRFFREIDDPIFMADLHPYWKEAASKFIMLMFIYFLFFWFCTHFNVMDIPFYCM